MLCVTERKLAHHAFEHFPNCRILPLRREIVRAVLRGEDIDQIADLDHGPPLVLSAAFRNEVLGAIGSKHTPIAPSWRPH